MDTPQAFIPPKWAYKFDEEFMTRKFGEKIGTYKGGLENFWWLEIGGLGDTVHDAEKNRDELLKIAFGVWDYYKNGPDGKAADKWALEWIGFLPGKRESRRYVGDHILTQNDVRAEGRFDDIVAYGGWSMDDQSPVLLPPFQGVCDWAVPEIGDEQLVRAIRTLDRAGHRAPSDILDFIRHRRLGILVSIAVAHRRQRHPAFFCPDQQRRAAVAGRLAYAVERHSVNPALQLVGDLPRQFPNASFRLHRQDDTLRGQRQFIVNLVLRPPSANVMPRRGARVSQALAAHVEP